MTEDKKKQLENHFSHIKGYHDTFLSCLDVRAEKEKVNPYLVELIDEMETLLQESKSIVNQPE